MKKLSLVFTAVLLTLCMALSLVSCSGLTTPPAEEEELSYVAIDINPSLELVVNENDVVVSVSALNEDAEIVLSGEDIEGLDIEKATEKIVALCEELGYLNDENTDVNFTVSSDKETVTAKLEGKLKDATERISKIAEAKFEMPEEIKERIEELKARHPEAGEKIDGAKARLIDAICELDPDFDVSVAVEMKVCDLAKKLAELKKAEGEKISDAAKEAMEKHFKEIKEEARKNIAGVYGEEYFDKWENHEAIKETLEKFQKEYEEIVISAEDVSEIETLLTIDLTELKDENGGVSLKALREHFKEKAVVIAEEIKTELDTILSEYEKEIVEHKDFESALEGIECPEFDKFEDFEKFAEEEKKHIDELKEQIGTDEAKKEQIKGHKEHMQGRFDELDDILADLEDEIEDAIDDAIDDAINDAINDFLPKN